MNFKLIQTLRYTYAMPFDGKLWAATTSCNIHLSKVSTPAASTASPENLSAKKISAKTHMYYIFLNFVEIKNSFGSLQTNPHPSILKFYMKRQSNIYLYAKMFSLIPYSWDWLWLTYYLVYWFSEYLSWHRYTHAAALRLVLAHYYLSHSKRSKAHSATIEPNNWLSISDLRLF